LVALPSKNEPASLECELGYFIFKGEYSVIPDDRAENISVRDWNDHYFAASESYDLNLEGRLIIDFPIEELERDNLDDEDLSALVNFTDKVDPTSERLLRSWCSYRKNQKRPGPNR
jgi:hypothetical protein